MKKLAMKLGVPKNASIEELDNLLAEIKQVGELVRQKRNERELRQEKSFLSDETYTGPRGGKYRVNSNGRKSYDVP